MAHRFPPFVLSVDGEVIKNIVNEAGATPFSQKYRNKIYITPYVNRMKVYGAEPSRLQRFVYSYFSKGDIIAEYLERLYWLYLDTPSEYEIDWIERILEILDDSAKSYKQDVSKRVKQLDKVLLKEEKIKVSGNFLFAYIDEGGYLNMYGEVGKASNGANVVRLSYPYGYGSPGYGVYRSYWTDYLPPTGTTLDKIHQEAIQEFLNIKYVLQYAFLLEFDRSTASWYLRHEGEIPTEIVVGMGVAYTKAMGKDEIDIILATKDKGIKHNLEEVHFKKKRGEVIVKAHKRRTKSGKRVYVRSYIRRKPKRKRKRR